MLLWGKAALLILAQATPTTTTAENSRMLMVAALQPSRAALDAADADDMARLADDDQEALHRLMLRHQRPLLDRLTRMLGNATEADELFHEAFLRVYGHRHSFRAGARFQAWLYTIALNLARNRLRTRRRQPIIVPLPDDDAGNGVVTTADLLDASPAPEEALARAEWLAGLDAALDALPPPLREPLEQFAFDDRAQADIATDLGCTVKAVETRVYHARQRLLRSLGVYAGNSEGFPLPRRKPIRRPVSVCGSDNPISRRK